LSARPGPGFQDPRRRRRRLVDSDRGDRSVSEQVLVSETGGVLTVALNRPDKKNAITQAMYAALAEAVERAQTDAAVRVVLFRAEGDSFSAGNDIGDFVAIASGGT